MRCPLSSASVDEWAGLSAWKSFFVDANSMNHLSSVWHGILPCFSIFPETFWLILAKTSEKGWVCAYFSVTNANPFAVYLYVFLAESIPDCS
jgi:hypothetical protein